MLALLDDLNLTFTFIFTFTYVKIEEHHRSMRLVQLVNSWNSSLLWATILKLGIYLSVLATLPQIQNIHLTHFLEHCVLLEREPSCRSP